MLNQSPFGWIVSIILKGLSPGAKTHTSTVWYHSSRLENKQSILHYQFSKISYLFLFYFNQSKDNFDKDSFKFAFLSDMIN